MADQLEVGSEALDFTLPDNHDRPWNLFEQLVHYRAVVVVFYRGDW